MYVNTPENDGTKKRDPKRNQDEITCEDNDYLDNLPIGKGKHLASSKMFSDQFETRGEDESPAHDHQSDIVILSVDHPTKFQPSIISQVHIIKSSHQKRPHHDENYVEDSQENK